MLVKIINNKIIGNINISNSSKEQDFLTNNPDYIKTDFDFVESLDLYEYDGTNFNLVSGWEAIKEEQEKEYLKNKLLLLKDQKCQEIDGNTAKAIIELAGSLESQANKQAKSSQLIRKELLGTITEEEKVKLDNLELLFKQIETLIEDGNHIEAQIQAIEITDTKSYEDCVTELEAIKV